VTRWSDSKRYSVTLCVLLALVAVAGGCGGSGQDGGSPQTEGGGRGLKIALLLPETHDRRYESADRPDFEKKVEELCAECEVLYENAGADESRQQSQAQGALAQGSKALVVDPVNTETASAIVESAQAKHVPVLAYDQLIVDSEPDVFVGFNYGEEGELPAEALARKLKAEGNPSGPIVMINGEPGNRDEHLFEDGAHRVFDANGVKIAAEYDTPFWEARLAQAEMQRAIKKLGNGGFAGVYGETDGIAGGAIAAMESAGIDPLERPTTGRDATPAGVQQVLGGQQYMTVYEPIEPEASRAAEIAVDLAKGRGVPPGKINGKVNNEKTRVPASLLKPTVVTKGNIKQTIVADGFVSTSQLCTGPYSSDCKAAGISG
jgi:D-xylose transport system substrate-binding protein